MVAAFISRAVIPVGYMPDPSSERDTPFAITLCSMGGATTVQVDFSEDPGPDAYGGDTCPYGLSVVHKLMPGQEAPALAGPASFLAFAQPLHEQVLAPQRALGPPLGSRAPPVGHFGPLA